MKAYEAIFTKKGSNPETVLIGANSMSSAAKKAEESKDGGEFELVTLTLTDKVIL